jgi:hypothetical protein
MIFPFWFVGTLTVIPNPGIEVCNIGGRELHIDIVGGNPGFFDELVDVGGGLERVPCAFDTIVVDGYIGGIGELIDTGVGVSIDVEHRHIG